ncbi:MAG TPA: hypothetical protein VJ044_05845 [Candidatus Hodarchaeales archaeon]|nr:hypothetical protein [Candidatus Hodarchaeales archaeon]
MASQMKFLKQKDTEILENLAEVLLGISSDKLEGFVSEADVYLKLVARQKFLIRDLRLLFRLFNSRFTAFLLIYRFKKFTSMSSKSKTRYVKKWMYSPILLMRSGFVTLKSLSGWAFYSLESNVNQEIRNYQGKTIGRETITPTLVFGKDSWVPNPRVEHGKFLAHDSQQILQRGDK